MNLNRRAFMQAGSLAPLGAILPARAAALDSTYESFHSKLADRHWLRLYEGIAEADTGTAYCDVEGDWPTKLSGILYRNGPGRMERDRRRYQHWFDGDGLIQKWTVNSDSTVTHRARLVQTHKYLFDESKNKLSLIGFGTSSDDSLSTSGPDAFNVGNISVLPKEDQLWALWEGGSAWQMDPDSLATKGTVELSTESSGLPFSAHPRVEPDGTIWNFGYASYLGALVIWRLDPGKKEPEISVIQRKPMSMPHDFVVTRKHLVLPLPPLHFDPEKEEAESFLDAHTWHPDRSLDILVMSKSDPTDYFVVELPAHWVFHFSNAWEDSAGTIRFEGFQYKDPGLMYDSFKNVMRGDPPESVYPSQSVQYSIDTKSRRAETQVLVGEFAASEFPSTDRRLSTERHEWLTMVFNSSAGTEKTRLGLFNGVARVNTSTGLTQTFTYAENEVAEEHLFVPDLESDQETDGWLLGTTLDFEKKLTHLNVLGLDAGKPELVARATLSRLMPLGLHGQFVTAV